MDTRRRSGIFGAMVEILQDEPGTAERDTDEAEFELFDVQLWFQTYMADERAQAEHADHAGVPFH